jgi:hypothetical protein
MDRILARTSIWGGDWVRLMGQTAMARIDGSLPALVPTLVDAAAADDGRLLRWTAVLALALSGDHDRAADLQSRWGLTAMPRRSYWGSPFEWAQAAEVALLLGTPDRAAAYERLTALTSPLVLIGSALAVWGPVDLLRSRLAGALGDDDLAARHAEAADAVTTRLRADHGIVAVWPLSRTPTTR